MAKSASNGGNLFQQWFLDGDCSSGSVRVLQERKGARDQVLDTIVEAATDHVIGLKVIESLGGFAKAMHVLKNRIPHAKIARSGMLGEILATEFLILETEFTAPIRRLRHRDTRDLAMRGDDVIGIQVKGARIRVMKVEAKSRAKLAKAAVDEARDGLAKHMGRPNPETLAFIECTLRLTGRDDEAEPFATLQRKTMRARDVCHLLFTLSGNNPTKFLETSSSLVSRGIELRLCGCYVQQHAAFIKQIFDKCLARSERNGDC